jgi:uncharacterized LabA/DUF88 family protein
MINIPLYGQVAVLIDADNAQLSYIEQVLKISEYYGLLEICRLYGDWNSPQLSSSCEKLDALKFERIQVDQVGKNATDHRLLIEAGEILGANYWETDVRVFIIVSGDGDFASACKRLQERGKQVIGIGNKNQSSLSLQESCDKFYYLEDLDHELSNLEKLHPIPPGELRKLFNALFFAYHKLTKEGDWVSFSHLGAQLREQDKNFERNFGKYKLSKWITIFAQDFEYHDQMIRRVKPKSLESL